MSTEAASIQPPAERETERSMATSLQESQASNGGCVKDYAKIVYLSIPTARLEGSHVVYDIEVGIPGCMWRLSKRYSEFFTLHQQLQWFYSFHSDELPKKKLLGNKTSTLIEKRRSKLESYLKHVLRTFPIPPPQFLNFINYQYYDVVGVTQALASRLFHVGEKILASSDPAILSVVQMYCITRRLKLPLEKRSNDTSLDVANLYEFVNRLKHLKLVSDTPDCLSSSLLSDLKFDLSIFRNLHSLQLDGCSMQQVEGWSHLLETLEMLVIRKSVKSISEALVQLTQSRREDQENGFMNYPPSCQWRALTHIYLSNNFLCEVDDSITMVPFLQLLDVSHNSIEEVPETALTHLHSLSFLDLSHNKLENIDSLHIKLGNIHTLDLSHNRIRSLVGLRKLYCVVTLNLKFNSIDDLSYLGYLGKLPCLESLQLDNNPICYQQQYRAEVLGALPLTYETVLLDGSKASDNELIAAKELISKRPPVSTPIESFSEGRRAPARRVVAVSDEREGGGGRIEGDRGTDDNASLREATEQLREQQGPNWLRLYNEQQERDAIQGSPGEPTATGQHPPPSKAQGYQTEGAGLIGKRTESDIRQLPGERADADLTPAAARVSHVADLETNSDSEDQTGHVFMVQAVTFSGSLSDLKALDTSEFRSLTSPSPSPSPSPDKQHESLVVKIDLDGDQILFVSLDNTRSESPKHFNRWRSITVLQNCLTTVCIEESSRSTASCRLLCLSTVEEANELCEMLLQLVRRASDPLPDSLDDPLPPSVPPPSPSGDQELTNSAQSLFATKIRGLYSHDGFFSTRIASELLAAAYYLQDLIPGSCHEISRYNTPDPSCQEEELVLAVRAGFLTPLSSHVEFSSLVLVTNRALHLLELDPAPSSLVLGETTHLMTVRLNEISKITVGLFDQSVRIESSSLGPLGTFTLFTRIYSVTQSLQNSLKEVLIAVKPVIESTDASQLSPTSHPVQIEYQGTSHLDQLKKRLFLHSIKDTYNSMNPEDIEVICEEGVKSIEIIFYLVINQLGGQDVLIPVSLILTKQMLYLCAEDYNDVRGVARVTPCFQVLRSNPVSTLDNIELFGSETGESEVSLYFEGIEEMGGSSRWRLCIPDAGLKQQFVTSLKKLWEQEFSQELKTSTVSAETESSISLHYHSIKHKQEEIPHIVMPLDLVNFAWQAARSPSAFHGIMKRMCPSIKQRQEQIAYLMLTWCSPYLRPHSLVPTCVILTDLCVYLCTTQHFYTLASDKPPSTESSVCLYESINLVQIQDVVLGLFDYHFRLDTNYATNTYAFLTFDNRQTSEFMSHLGDKLKKVLNPTLGQEEIPNKEVSELEAKFSLTEVLLSSPSDTEIQKLTEALHFEARKVVPASQLEGSSSIISYVLVLYDIGEANMQPHAVLITGQALFLCRIDLVRWPIAKFVVSPPASIQYEVVDVIAYEWVEYVELADFKSSAFKIVFTPQRNTEPAEETNSNSGSEEYIDLPQPLIGSSRWNLMTKDYIQRDMFLKTLDGVYQGRGNNRPVSIQLSTNTIHS